MASAVGWRRTRGNSSVLVTPVSCLRMSARRCLLSAPLANSCRLTGSNNLVSRTWRKSETLKWMVTLSRNPFRRQWSGKKYRLSRLDLEIVVVNRQRLGRLPSVWLAPPVWRAALPLWWLPAGFPCYRQHAPRFAQGAVPCLARCDRGREGKSRPPALAPHGHELEGGFRAAAQAWPLV